MTNALRKRPIYEVTTIENHNEITELDFKKVWANCEQCGAISWFRNTNWQNCGASWVKFEISMFIRVRSNIQKYKSPEKWKETWCNVSVFSFLWEKEMTYLKTWLWQFAFTVIISTFFPQTQNSHLVFYAWLSPLWRLTYHHQQKSHHMNVASSLRTF